MLTTYSIETRNGTETFATDLTPGQAAQAILQANGEARRVSPFAYDLASRQIGNRKPLSPKQTAWLVKMGLPYARPKTAASDAPKANLGNIVDFLERAARNLKTPGIEVPGLKIKRAGSQSRYPGHYHVSAGGYGSQYFGRIEPDGTFHARRDLPAQAKETLSRWNSAPAEIVSDAVAHGKATGNCCFCARELSTPESLDAGYGPVCAGHYGLPWGD